MILPNTRTIMFGSIMRRIFSSLTIVQRASTPGGAAKRLPVLCCWLIALCGVLTACYDGITLNVQAIVLSVEGLAKLNHQSKSPQSITTRSRLSVGDSIQTGDQAQLQSLLVPGMSIALGPNSELQIEQLRMGKDGNAMVNSIRLRTARLRLMRGVVDATVETSDVPQVDLTVETALGIVVAHAGSLLRIETTQEHARILCVRGRLQLQAARYPATVLEPGFFEDWRGLIGGPRPADSEAKAQGDLVETLENEHMLLSLENSKRFAPVPWRRQTPQNP